MGVYDLFVYAPVQISPNDYVWVWNDAHRETPDYVCSTYYP